MNIVFPSLEESRNIMSNADYIKHLRPIEKKHRFGPGPLAESVRNSVTVFSDSEKQTLAWYFSILGPQLNIKGSGLIPTSSLKLIKLKTGYEWNCPFTIGTNTIVISSKCLEIAESGKGNSYHKTQMLVTLTHELVHLHQRNNTGKYIDIYEHIFGFIRKPVKLSNYLAQYVVTNPDGYNYDWIMAFRIGAELKLFLPIALVNEKGTITGVLVELTTQNGKIYHNMANTVIPIEAFPLYYHQFGVQKQLYHPNEIIADLIAEYLIQGHVYDTKTFNGPSLYSEIDKLLRFF